MVRPDDTAKIGASRMAQITDNHVEWAVVDRLRAMLEETPHLCERSSPRRFIESPQRPNRGFHLLGALVGAGIRCLSHKTCQQDRYENKVEGDLQGNQIGSMARMVGGVPDGPEHLK